MAGTTGARIVLDQLLLYYDAANQKSFPSSGSSLYDLSGNLVNGNLYNVSISSEKSGAFIFDGVNSYIDMNTTLSLSRFGSSCEFWISRGNTARSSLLTYQQSSFISHVEVSTNKFITETVNNCNTFDSPSFSFNSNEWYNIVFKFDSNKSYWYVNGEFLGETPSYGLNNCVLPASELLDNLNIRYIGQNVGYSDNFDGKLSVFKVYNKALSDAEVKQNFNALRNRFGI